MNSDRSEVTPATHISLAKSKSIDDGASSGASALGPHRATGASPSKTQGLHVDRKHASKAQCAQCESTFKTPGRRAEDQSGQGQARSSALKEATETAEEAVRTRGSTPEDERRSRSRSKTPEAAPGKEESPQPQWERRKPCFDWTANLENCTLVVHSGESSPEGSENAAKDEQLAASGVSNSSPFPTAPSEQGAGDIGPIDGDDKQVGNNTTMADTEAVAGIKADPPVKRLTLAQGRERAQASKAAAKAGEASAKKRAAPSSSPRGSSSKLFSDSESENEEGTIHEDQEVSIDLDEQQQYQAAASGSHARQTAAATAVRSSSGGGALYPQGYFPPEPSTRAPALL
ncbi:hypothetical protein PF010_g19375 [Phytophthora fragariae]|uniref:Uncharacterized protein n=1 Tax=Phytophthora fragariae TaxID=53985 RepID=A0A6G0KHM1_9STRA|nr:hypothetical protein PF010_g19375 [Phytophthora fragariae]